MDENTVVKPVWLHAEKTQPAIKKQHATKAEILRARSQDLAKQQNKFTAEEETVEVAEYLLGTETYAFQLKYLVEVCSLSEVTYIPCAPPYVAGVINLRGQIITLIDIHLFLGITAKPVKIFNKALIVGKEKCAVGFLADEVIGARKVSLKELQSDLPGLKGLCADYLYGVTPDRLVILDGNRILDDPRLNRAST